MKSKTFCSKFIKTSFIKQLWVMGIVTLTLFLGMFVPLTITMNNWASYTYLREDMLYEYVRYMVQSDAVYVLTVGLAVLVAIIHFAYLHSGKQQDFYGSIPVKRDSLYLQKVVYAVIDYVIPYTVVLGLCMLLGLTKGLVTSSLAVYMAETWVLTILEFLLIYLVTVLAILLTGRLWVAFLGTCVFLGLGSWLQLLTESAMGEFFDTYYNVSNQPGLSYLSPVYLIYHIRNQIFELEDQMKMISGEYIFLIFVVAVICAALIMLNRWVIKKRPSEKAGTSMAFEIPARIIHMVMSVTLGFTIGLFMMSFVYANEIVWFYMCSVVGTALTYILMQFIYTLDIRRTFLYKWQIFAVEAAIILACSIFSFDILGYDDYLPKQEQLESVAIRYLDDNSYANYYINNKYVDGIEYSLEKMELEPDDRTYGFLESIVGDSDQMGSSLVECESVYVMYRLKNGITQIRQYWVPMRNYMDEFQYFYDQDNFRQVMIPSLLAESLEIDDVRNIRIYYGGQEQDIYDAEKDNIDATALVEAYNRDMKHMDSSVFIESVPVAALHLSFTGSDYMTNVTSFVYEECEETMALLKEMGYDPISAVTPEKVAKIYIEDYEAVYTSEKEAEVVMETGINPSYTIVDNDEIARILDASIDGQYATVWQNRSGRYHIRVELNESFGNYPLEYYAAFIEGLVPVDVLDAKNATVIY